MENIVEKILNSIRRRGFIKFCAIIFFDIFYLINDFFKLVLSRKKNILYISGCQGGSGFYRCSNQAEEMKAFGLTSSIEVRVTHLLPLIIRKYNVIVFQRVVFNKKIKKTILKIKNNNKIALFETDDLIFDSEYFKHMAICNAFDENAERLYGAGIGRELLEDPYVENIIVSTQPLKRAILDKYPDKNVFVSENKLSRSQIKFAQRAYKQRYKYIVNDGKVRIGYFSGSPTHNADFGVIAPVLVEIMANNENVVLVIVGYLNPGLEFNKFESQIERYEPISMAKLPRLILRVDINIVPLELDNPFCQSKSAIKFLEASILKIPTIASATEPFQSIIQNRVNGFYAKNNSEWLEYLNSLIGNKNIREKIGLKAYKSIQDNYVIQNQIEPSNLVEFIKENSG